MQPMQTHQQGLKNYANRFVLQNATRKAYVTVPIKMIKENDFKKDYIYDNGKALRLNNRKIYESSKLKETTK